MNYRQLEEVLIPLLAQRDAAEKGSHEYNVIVAEIGKMIDKYPDAQTICEEYNIAPSE